MGLLYKSQNVLEIDAYRCYSSPGEHMVRTSDDTSKIKMKVRKTPLFLIMAQSSCQFNQKPHKMGQTSMIC